MPFTFVSLSLSLSLFLLCSCLFTFSKMHPLLPPSNPSSVAPHLNLTFNSKQKTTRFCSKAKISCISPAAVCPHLFLWLPPSPLSPLLVQICGFYFSCVSLTALFHVSSVQSVLASSQTSKMHFELFLYLIDTLLQYGATSIWRRTFIHSFFFSFAFWGM